MFRWNKEKMIDLACIEDMTVPEIASIAGTSVSAVEKFYNKNRAELFAARNETAVPESTYITVMDLWAEQYSNAEIAQRTGLSSTVVRRLIMIAEHDEAPIDQGAGLELLALYAAHPGRRYEDYDTAPVAMAA
jgi:DNA-directed RNA polymerase specialized sigma24 family protein